MAAPTLKQLAAGEAFFHEGDPSNVVFRLVSGKAAVQREIEGRPIILGYVEPGEFVGEMGVIEQLPRIATARAETDCVAEILTEDQFFEQISSENTAARELILRLCSRLRLADDTLAKRGADIFRQPLGDILGQTVEPGAFRYNTPVFAISGESPLTKSAIGAAPISVSELPYVVGRSPESDESQPRYSCQLKIKQKPPFRLSRNHFMITGTPGRLEVCDLDSTLGTTVNNQTIGHHFKTDRFPLQPGVNTIVAGGHDSPFRFSVTVP